MNFAFLCKPAVGNATVSPFPLSDISYGEMAFPKTFWGTAFPVDYTAVVTCQLW